MKKKPFNVPSPPPIPPIDSEKGLSTFQKIAAEPIPASIDLEQLKMEQQYNPKNLVVV